MAQFSLTARRIDLGVAAYFERVSAVLDTRQCSAG